MSFNDYTYYKSVYSNLIENVDVVLHDISNIKIQHIDIEKKNEETYTKLRGLRNVFVQDVEKLDKNAVWDRFTIAFFGETNAGKSTIIESLRISMFEDEKLINSQLKKSLYINISELNKKAEDVITAIVESKQVQIKKLNLQLDNINEKAKRLENTLWSNWLTVLRAWFGLLPILFFEKKRKSLEDEIFEVNSIVPEHDDKVCELIAMTNELKKEREQIFDGKIIGTGIPDFTQSCVEYYFNQDEKPFTLIDVPGIEGNENEYETIIMDAVSKAHCVFYVCSAGKLPESATITKIKKYLKEQTEVYFLLNEKKNTYSYEDIHTFEAMHPTAEKFKTDISNQMHYELGEFYKGCYSLQGLMAFCSLAKIQEEERNFKFQKKLLDKFGTYENLYSISQLEKVESLIRFQLKEMERKIINANVQKGIHAAIDFKSKIQEIRNAEYSNDFFQHIEKESNAAKDKNNNNFRELENGFLQISDRFSNLTIENLRIKLYHLIDNKEDNPLLNDSDSRSLQSPLYSNQEKKMKFIAECYCQYIFDDLSEKYNDASQIIVSRFIKEITDNINKMHNNIKQISSVRFSDFDNNKIGGFEALFSIDLGKYVVVAMSVGGMAWTGAGIGTIVFPGLGSALGATIGAAVGLLFAGIKWFMNKETPESKAKKQIDEKLANIKTEIKTKLEVTNRIIIDDCKKNVIDKVRIMLDDNVNGIKAIQTILDAKTDKLELLIEELKNSKN